MGNSVEEATVYGAAASAVLAAVGALASVVTSVVGWFRPASAAPAAKGTSK